MRWFAFDSSHPHKETVLTELKPNILLITSDQQHFTALGVTNPKIKTPALDRLAREGMRFDRAYCANPVSSPSRSTLITGLYPSTHHCWTIGVKLPEDVPTVGETFQEHGYRTTLIGKAHFQPNNNGDFLEAHPKLRDLDFWRDFHGPFYGFEHIELTRNHTDEHLVGQHYALWMEEQGLANWRDYFGKWPQEPNEKRRRHAWDLPQEFHYTTWTGERTRARIEHHTQKKEPYFLWSSYHDPHPSYLVPEPWASMYNPEDMEPGELTDKELELLPPHFAKTQQPDADWSMYKDPDGYSNHGFCYHHTDRAQLQKNMATYYGMVSFMDHEIGLTLDTLDRTGQADNTLVVFTTDHGHFLGQHGLIAKGAFHFEDMLKVPMLARFPGKIPEGQVNTSMQSLVDYAPTFLDTCGIQIPGIMQGRSQWDVWQGKSASARDHVLVENRHQPTKLHLRSYINERYKITVYRGADYGELFDLQDDPGETRNLWDNPDAAELKSHLLQCFVQAEISREPTRMPRVWGA